jgi:cytochrome c oxidase subunit 3|tara:strand:+ start:597 stop:1319 length:723 start_codon:yes stop_codon:yes gene_type:complete
MVVGCGILLSALSLLTAFAWEMPMLGIILGGATLAIFAVGLAGWAREFYTEGEEEGLGPIAVAAFIVSEVMIFGTVFAAFWVGRIEHLDEWSSYIPEGMHISFAIWLTLILWASSITILVSERAFHAGNKSRALLWLAITFGLGTLFVVLHMNEWANLVEEGFTPGVNIYATSFFGLTGVHTSHVLVGLFIHAVLFYVIYSGLMSKGRTTLFTGAALYWHFVDIMWLLVAGNAYLIGSTV